MLVAADGDSTLGDCYRLNMKYPLKVMYQRVGAQLGDVILETLEGRA